jgi:2'-5' RNA ligase
VHVESVPGLDVLRDHWWWRPGWAPGRRRLAWHLTFAGQEPLLRLVRDCQSALDPIDALDPVPTQWLHLTLADAGPASTLADDDVSRLADLGRARVAALPPIEVQFATAVLFAESVVLVPEPTDAVRALRDALVECVRAVRGDTSPDTSSAFVPHLSLAYVNAEADPLPVLSALRGVDSAPALGVRPTVSLIELHRDHGRYEWRTIAACPPA